MKKYKIIPIKYFYLSYFIINLIMSISLTQGWFNSNISAYNSFGYILLQIIGSLSFLALVFFIVLLITKNSKRRIITLTIISSVLTILILFLEGFSSMFTLFFSYTQLVSFKNPLLTKLITGYVLYFLGMFKSFCFMFPVLLLLILIMVSIFTKQDEKVIKNYKITIPSLSASILTIIILFVSFSVNIKDTYNSVSTNTVYGSSYMGVYNYYIYSIKDLSTKELILNEDKLTLVNEYLNEHKYQKTTESSEENKNLIILQLEAINNYVIGLEIDGKLIAPNLTALSKMGYYNNNFYSAAGMGNTSDCEYATLTGLYPNGNDLSIFNVIGENQPTLSKDFNNKGYNTFSIHGNDGIFYNRNHLHENFFGFNEHIDKNDLLERNKNLSLIKDWISDESLLEESINIYKEQTKPFFSYNILVTSHSPFSITDDIEAYNNKSLTSLANDYISYVMYVDKQIGNFINLLKENNLYDNSVIVLFGDHSSSLLQRDVESITEKKYSDIEFRLEMQNVPFMILSNNINPIIDERVHSNVDIYPTISNMFNLNSKYSFGTNIFSDNNSYVYNTRCLDIIFNDYVISLPSKSVYYFNNDTKKLSKEDINKIINDFNERKYANDLIVYSNHLSK